MGFSSQFQPVYYFEDKNNDSFWYSNHFPVSCWQ